MQKKLQIVHRNMDESFFLHTVGVLVKYYIILYFILIVKIDF